MATRSSWMAAVCSEFRVMGSDGCGQGARAVADPPAGVFAAHWERLMQPVDVLGRPTTRSNSRPSASISAVLLAVSHSIGPEMAISFGSVSLSWVLMSSSGCRIGWGTREAPRSVWDYLPRVYRPAFLLDSAALDTELPPALF
jgi:hypothetical protein